MEQVMQAGRSRLQRPRALSEHTVSESCQAVLSRTTTRPADGSVENVKASRESMQQQYAGIPPRKPMPSWTSSTTMPAIHTAVVDQPSKGPLVKPYH